MAFPLLIKTVLQVAAVPFRVTTNGVEVLIITSRQRNRWIIPKGWPQEARTLAAAAEQEAWEEAGVLGVVSTNPIGRYRGAKRTDKGYEVATDVVVFPLLVEHEVDEWPEQSARRRSWHPFTEATDKLAERQLSRLLVGSLHSDGDKLRSLSVQLRSSG